MKYLFSLSLVLLFISASAQLTYETLYVDYDSAWTLRNLKIVPIRRKGGGAMPEGIPGLVSLNQALSRGLATVTERGTTAVENVHWLRINTRSDKPVFIAAGEIVSGGRQDRMITRDTILSPSSKDQYVPTMCVEEGRWSEKEKKFAYGSLANGHLRKVLDSTPNQVLIWKEIDHQLESGAFKNKTQAYLSRTQDKKYVQVNDDYFYWFMDKFRRSDSTIIGFAALSGDRVIGSDVFASTDLFYQQLEPLLHSYIDEAVLFGAPVTIPDPPVKRYMDKLLKSEASQEEFTRKNGHIFRQDGKVIHVNTFAKEQ